MPLSSSSPRPWGTAPLPGSSGPFPGDEAASAQVSGFGWFVGRGYRLPLRVVSEACFEPGTHSGSRGEAKNKLFQFYRPNLHKEAPKRELTDEEKILASSGRSDMIATDAPQMIEGTTQTVYVQLAHGAVPPPPPETWGAYQKQARANGSGK